MNLHLISVPYRYDERGEGLGAGPEALVKAGLADAVERAGHQVTNSSVSELPVDETEAGRTAVNIGKLGAVTAGKVAEARRDNCPTLVLTGDDTASIGVIAGLEQADGAGARIGVVWLDAHADFNTPETSYSGILAGMPLAILAGLAGPNWREAAGLQAPIATDRILLAGVRDVDEKEETLLRSTGVSVVTTAELRQGERFSEALARLVDRIDLIAINIDLDLLDPHLVPSASTPAQHGLEINELAVVLREVLATGKVAAVTVSSLNPGGGQRGQKSIATSMAVLESALPAWKTTPTRTTGD